MSYKFLFLFLFSFTSLSAQVTTRINGNVREAYSFQPLANASLVFTSESNKTWSTTTDTSGYFNIIDIEPGRFDISINLKGYQSENIRGFLIGRSQGALLFDLHLNTTDLPELIVSEKKSGSYIHPLSNVLTVTREETEKLPAGFFDPARLFTNQAGVTSMNDGANHLIIRGNNPAFVKWMLHGTEIINPNHLSNAGTFNDQASTSGGGVNMISATVLENTYLHKGPYNATVGNALAGALDLNLRKGSGSELKTEAQISLLGLELGLQGPISNKGASFITRYRYSTVGLLADLGAKFGDEDISYQDIMAHISIPSKKNDLSVFFFSGNNFNDYIGKQDSSLRKIDKERYNIRFTGNQLITGILDDYKINIHNRLLTDVIYSKLNTTRNSTLINTSGGQFIADQSQGKLSIHPRWVLLAGSNKVLTTGIQLSLNTDKTEYNVLSPNLDARGNIHYTLFQPYTNLLIERGKWSLQGGVHGLIKNEIHIDPRIQLRYYVKSNQSIQVNAGTYSQIGTPATFFKAVDFKPMKSVQSQVSYEIVMNNHTWTNAVFYQHHYNIPTNRFSLSFLNEAQGTSSFYFPNSKSDVYGFESGIEGKWGKWSHTHNLSLFRSFFQTPEISSTAGRFDQRVLIHNYFGREWSKQRDKSKKLVGLFTGVHYGGSLRDSAIPAASNTIPYSITRPDQFRLDFRVYRRKFYTSMNTLLALDIQNLTNQQNFSYSYFDTIMNKVNFQYQLGILPNLSYTIEF